MSSLNIMHGLTITASIVSINNNYTENSTSVPKNIVFNIKRKEELKNCFDYEIVENWFQASSKYNKKQKQKIIKIDTILKDSLEKTTYNWRTSKGLSKELNVPEKIISTTLLEMAKQKKVFIGKKSDGEKIYSLISSYEKNTDFFTKLKDATRGYIIR